MPYECRLCGRVWADFPHGNQVSAPRGGFRLVLIRDQRTNAVLAHDLRSTDYVPLDAEVEDESSSPTRAEVVT